MAKCVTTYQSLFHIGWQIRVLPASGSISVHVKHHDRVEYLWWWSILPFYLLGPLFYDTWTSCCFQDFRLTNITWDSEILFLIQWKGSKKQMKGWWMSCTQFTEEQKSEFGSLDCMQINGLLFPQIKPAVLLSLRLHSSKYRKWISRKFYGKIQFKLYFRSRVWLTAC